MLVESTPEGQMGKCLARIRILEDQTCAAHLKPTEP